MSTPTITHSFVVEHTDEESTQRQILVAVNDKSETLLTFKTKGKDEEEFESMICLTQTGIEMLCHSLNILNSDLQLYLHPEGPKQ